MPYIIPNVVESTDATASTSTAYGLNIGESAQGSLAATGDHDWYRVSLTAGQSYSFALVGTGTINVRDAYLNLRNAGGNTIASDDDGGPSYNSTIIFTAPTSGTYYLDAGSYNDGSTGQYGLSATIGSRPNYDIPMGGGAIDADLSWSAGRYVGDDHLWVPPVGGELHRIGLRHLDLHPVFHRASIGTAIDPANVVGYLRRRLPADRPPAVTPTARRS